MNTCLMALLFVAGFLALVAAISVLAVLEHYWPWALQMVGVFL